MLVPHPTNPRRGGIAALLIILLLIVSAGGAAFYYFKEANKEDYQTETIQIATSISQSLRQLDESPTSQELHNLQKQINNYTSREGADLSALESWNSKLQKAKTQIAENDLQANEFQNRIESFDSNNSIAELEAFEKELKPFAHSLDPFTRNRLLENWNQRKKAILAEIRSVSATIIAKTFPSGAKTYLNGEYIGLSSLGIQKVRKGQHLLTFEKDGYLTAELEVTVTQSEKIELETIELQLATHPVSVTVTGGKKNSKILVSIEKSADNNKNLLLYIDEKQGREVVFENAPLGSLTISVTLDNRLAHEQAYTNTTAQTKPLKIDL